MPRRAYETAAGDSPVASATSRIVARFGCCGTFSSLGIRRPFASLVVAATVQARHAVAKSLMAVLCSAAAGGQSLDAAGA